MGVIQEQREKVASVIGAKLANDLTVEQLPAILHAIEGDEHEVRICAKQASRDGVDNPATLLLWLIREKKHAGPATEPSPVRNVVPPPPLPSEAELARRREMADRWQRVQRAISRSSEIRDLWNAMYNHANPPNNEEAATICAEIIEVLDEMNAQKEAHA